MTGLKRQWTLVSLAILLAAAGCRMGRPATVSGPPGGYTVRRPSPAPVPRSAPERLARTTPATLPPPSASPPARPAAAFRAPDPTWRPYGRERPWRWIVVHHSATPSGSAAIFDDWHRNGRHWDELGYHFVIGNGTETGDGEVEVGGRWSKQKHGAHCRVGESEEYNDFGIGICLVGDFDHGRPSEAQMRALVMLVDWLTARYHIRDDHVVGHRDVKVTNCPGRNFSFGDLMARVRARREARRRARSR